MSESAATEAYLAYWHIEQGTWDKFLVMLREAVERRIASTAYQEHVAQIGQALLTREVRRVIHELD